jgi:flagellar basal body-associated protein FliL
MHNSPQMKCQSCGAFLPQGDDSVVRCSYCGVEARLRSRIRLSFPKPTTTPSSSGRSIAIFFIVFFLAALLISSLIGIVAVSRSEDARPPIKAPPAPPPAPPSTEVLLTYFLAEIPGNDGPHYVKTGVNFMLTDADTVRIFDTRRELIRDAVKMILAEQSYERMANPSKRLAVIDEIEEGVEMIIGKDKIVNAEFRHFALQ